MIYYLRMSKWIYYLYDSKNGVCKDMIDEKYQKLYFIKITQ
jgi:hypothetical protein